MSALEVSDRYGDWMQTWTGHKFYPLDPRAEDFAIEDIAHALANVCRFGGHCRVFYSVAQHCVRVSHNVPASLALAGLLHDAAEAFIGDMVRPLKRMHEMQSYRDCELRIRGVIAAKFDLLDVHDPDELIRLADDRALATERRDLFDDALPWNPLPPPFADEIVPWLPTKAEMLFLDRYDRLRNR